MKEIQEYIDAFIFSRKAAMRSDATIACYEYSLTGLAGFLTSWPPVAHDIRRFLADCRDRGLSKVTVRDHWDRLSVWFRWLVTEGYLAENPMKRVEQPSVPKLLPRGTHPSDVQAMLNYLTNEVARDKKNLWKKRDLAMICFLFDTGVRNQEVRTLKMCNLWVKRRGAIVHGKGDVERIVTFGAQTQKALARWLACHPGGELVFPTTTGTEMDRFIVLRIVKKASNAAGIATRVTPHTFRHAATLALLDLGGNVIDVQGQMGHHDLSMTERYAQATVRHRLHLHDRFSPLDHLDELAELVW